MSIKGFNKAGHTPTLVASWVHFDISFMVWVLLGALGAYVASDLGLTSAQKGLMVAVPALGGSLFRLILGSLADRVGIKRIGLVSMGLTLVPLGWGWLAGGTYGQVLGIGLLLGFAGASFAVALPLVSRWYPPEHQGLALGIAGSGNSGTIIAALSAPRLAEHFGWHATFGLATIPVAAAWLVFALMAKEPTRPAPGLTGGASSAGGSVPHSPGVFPLLKEQDARWLCAFYAVTFGGFVGLAGYMPIFFVDNFDLGKVTAGSYAALCAGAGSLLRPIGGALADRFGGTKVLTAAFFVVSAAMAVLATLPGLGYTVALLFGTMGMLGVGNGAVFQVVPQRFPTRIGAMTGLVGAAGGVGGFILPFAFGALEGATGSFAPGFALFMLAGLITAGAVVWRQRVWRENWELEVAF